MWRRKIQSSEIQLREAIIPDGLTLMLIQATVNGFHASFLKEYMKSGDKGGRVGETEEKDRSRFDQNTFMCMSVTLKQ